MTEVNNITIEKIIEDVPDNANGNNTNTAAADAATGPNGSNPLCTTSPNGSASALSTIVESVPHDNDNSTNTATADAATDNNDSSPLLCANYPNASALARSTIV